MVFCTSCGSQNDQGKAFCTGCGDSLPKQENTGEDAPIPGRKTSSPKMKIVAVIFILAVAFIGGLHSYLSNKYSSTHFIDRVVTALGEGDGEELLENLTIEDENIDSDKEILKEFSIFISNQIDLEDLRSQLIKGVKVIGDSGTSWEIEDNQGNILFKIKPGKKKWWLYEQYNLVIVPFEQVFVTNLKENPVKVEVEGRILEVIPKENSDALPVIPRKLLGDATLSSKYGNQSLHYETIPSEAEKNKIVTPLNFQVNNVMIESNKEEAVLYVNGKSTGESIKEKGNILAEVPEDASISIHAVKRGNNGKEQLSNIVAYSGEETIHLLFDEDEGAAITEEGSGQMQTDGSEDEAVTTSEDPDFGDKLFNTVDQYLVGAVEAINTGHFDYVKNFVVPGSPVYEELVDYAAYLQEKGISEDLHNVELLEFQEMDHRQYRVVVGTEYTIYYDDGSKKTKKFTETFQVHDTSWGIGVYKLVETVEQ